MAEEKEEWPFINHYFIKCSRLVGFIATLVFLAVVLSTHHFSPKKFVFDAKSLECEPAEYKEDVMMDIIDFKKIFHRGDRTYSKFQLVEYVLDGVMPVDNNNADKKSRMRQPNRTEIPVFINPGYGDSMDSHLALARIATDLTNAKNYRFRFYSLYPNQEAAHWSSTHYLYIRTFSEYSHFHLEKLYPKKRIIQICHLFGGDLGVRSAMEQYYARTRGIMTNTETGNLPDLFIRESAPHTLPGYYGTDIQSSIRANLRDWVEFKTRFSLGMISFDAGYDDTAVDTSWLKGKDIDRIPVWTIDGVPDTGLSAQKMLTCKPFLNQIADLLISYAEKDPDETGDSVAKAFYKKWEKKMQETVPIEWKKDNYDFVIRSGEKYEFVVNGARWIDVSLQRTENIWLNIKGSCLSSATLIRQNKFIRRKEKSLEFGIFQTKQFEDIKLLLESSSECNVEIETTPSWVAYTQRFYHPVVTDPHYFWVGAQIVSTYLFMLESEKRSFRMEHQFYCYISFIAAVLYQIFGTFGMNHFGAGMALGAGFAMSIHYVFSMIDQFFFNMYLRRNLDSYTSEHLRNVFFTYTLIACGGFLYSPAVGACVITVLIGISSRLFLIIPLILTYLPNFYAAYDSVFTPGSQNFHMGTAPIVLIYSLVGIIANIRKVANKMRPPPRTFLRNLAYFCFFVQCCTANALLETHYSIGFALLSYSQYARNYVPVALQERRLDLDELEREYEELDEEDEEV